MTVFIIEDEPLGLERLKEQLLSVDYDIEIVGDADSIQSSVEWLKVNTPDLILMDIELADGQCFEIFKQVKVTSAVIFTTSYDEFALQAFKVNSIDYLLKPIRKTELISAFDKYQSLKDRFSGTEFSIDKLLEQLRPDTKTFRSRFLVKQGQKLVSIDVFEIAYFYSDERVVFFKTWNNQRYIVDYNLEEIEAMLDPVEFSRINRGFIIHIKSISEIHSHFNGKLKLILKPSSEKEVIVSRENAMNFKIWIGK
jgi:two-component system, LytTR family, response regulator LytT